jgi:anti-anti-sigma factor
MALAHVVERVADRLTVVLAGEADLTGAEQLRDALFDAVAERPRSIVVDLRGLVFIDSQSIGALMAARRAALAHGCALSIAHPHGQVLRVLRVAGLLDLLVRGRAADEVAGGPGGFACA